VVLVREALVADAPEIVRLGALMYTAVGNEPHADWRPYAESLIAARLGNDLIGVVVDGDNGELASCGLANISPRLPQPGVSATSIAYIQWVSTAPPYQRRGYARAVMEALIEACDVRGVRVIELHATPIGRELYESLDFVIKSDNIAMNLVRPVGIPDGRPPLFWRRS
jgi:GNAT superfamily N-acetyltransferase